MVFIQINIKDDELDKEIEIYKAEHRLDSKSETVEQILKEFFKQKGDKNEDTKSNRRK